MGVVRSMAEGETAPAAPQSESFLRRARIASSSTPSMDSWKVSADNLFSQLRQCPQGMRVLWDCAPKAHKEICKAIILQHVFPEEDSDDLEEQFAQLLGHLFQAEVAGTSDLNRLLREDSLACVLSAAYGRRRRAESFARSLLEPIFVDIMRDPSIRIGTTSQAYDPELLHSCTLRVIDAICSHIDEFPIGFAHASSAIVAALPMHPMIKVGNPPSATSAVGAVVFLRYIVPFAVQYGQARQQAATLFFCDLGSVLQKACSGGKFGSGHKNESLNSTIEESWPRLKHAFARLSSIDRSVPIQQVAVAAAPTGEYNASELSVFVSFLESFKTSSPPPSTLPELLLLQTLHELQSLLSQLPAAQQPPLIPLAAQNVDPAVCCPKEGPAAAPILNASLCGPHIMDDSSVISRFTFWWCNRLFKLGYSKPLTADDLWPAPSRTLCSSSVQLFESAWNLSNGSAKVQKPGMRLFKTAWKCFGHMFLTSVVLQFIWLSLALSLPSFFLRQMISFANNPEEPLRNGILYAVFMFIAQLTSVMCLHNQWNLAVNIGLQLRSALSSMVFRKAMHLRCITGSGGNTAGQLVNIISTDPERVIMACNYWLFLFSAPIMIAIGLGLLWREVGVAALPGVALMIIFTVVSGYFGGRIMEIRKKSLAAADLRIRIISEIVQAIKLVKMLGWQQQIVSSVKRARATETASLVSLAMIKSLNITVSFVSSLLIIAATFSVYVASSDVLVSAKAFTVLSLFNVLRFPLIMLPMTMKFVGECWVAFQRIENFLEQEEAEEDPHLSAQSCGKDKALVMRDCVMSWDGKTPTLQGNPEELPPAHEAAGADSNLTHTFSSSPVASNATVSSDSAVEHVAHVSESPFSVHESSVVKSPKPADNVASLHVDSSKTFNGLHLSIPKGSFLSVVGAVGAGKTTFLCSLIGSVPRLQGSVSINGKVAYCAQAPWIFFASLRENILFSSDYDEAWYNKVIDLCCLRRDLGLLPNGDMTVIGERGINLSGGQKARLALARAVYSRADIYVLDDILAAVDAQVSRKLFDDVIMGQLAGKTVILATHALQLLLPQHSCLYIDSGRACLSDWQTISSRHASAFSLSVHSKHLEPSSPALMAAAAPTAESAVAPVKSKAASETTASVNAAAGGTGAVTFNTYSNYFNSAPGKSATMVVCVLVFIVGQVIRVAADYWLAIWSSDRLDQSQSWYLVGYWIFVFVLVPYVFFRSWVFLYALLQASRKLHDDLFHAVVNGVTSFFDVVPCGHVISRLSTDTDVLDDQLPEFMEQTISLWLVILSIVLVVSTQYPWFILPLAVLMVAFLFVNEFFRRSSREMQKIDSTSRAPILSWFAECVQGIDSVRAFGAAPRVAQHFEKLVDANTRPKFCFFVASRWIGLRLDLLCCLVTLAAALFSVAARGSGLDGATVGFVLSYALQAASLFQWTVRVTNEVMNKMVSVSRLSEFTSRVPIEPDVVDTDLPAVARPGSMEMVSLDSVASVANVADTRLDRSSSRGDASQVLDEMWPRTGSIVFKSFSMSYREGLPEVLKDVHLSIAHGARIGVVGRTGSGKSTLIMALYRMGFVTGGSIFIDGVDIGRIPLVRLRSALSIVPQEAQLFIGTVRSNLDPSGSLADAELMQALTRVQMADAVVSMGGLDAAISENGSNMSAGQRQLFCVARAILKRPKILLIDEATASVDSATDEKLQIIIRREFADCTTLTIAHRLHTIADSDKLVVLDAGCVAQFGTVHECSKGGIYRSLLKDT